MRSSIASLLCVLLLAPSALAAEEPASQSPPKELSSETAQQPAADPYQVPEGDGEELLQFLKQIEQRKQESLATYQEAQRKAQQEYTQSLSRCNEAGKAAAQRIMALKLDPGSEAMIAAAEFILPDRLREFGTASVEMQKETVLLATSLLESRAKKGLEMKDLMMAQSLARALENSDQTALAAETCEKFGELFGKSGNAQIARYADYFAGMGRRLALVGNPMEMAGKTVDGTDFDWSAYRGKYVLVDFWATWCAPCRAELPNLKGYYQTYHDRGFEIVGISLDRDAKQLEAYLRDERVPWPTLYEREGGGSHPVAKMYGISAIPTMFFVDKEGKVVSVTARTSLHGLLNRHLGGRYGKALPFVLEGDWKAAADVHKYKEGEPWNEEYALAVAVPQLMMGDLEGYQQTCRLAFEKRATSHVFARHGLAYLCYLGPDPGIEQSKIAAMMDIGMERVSPNALALVRGMRELRSGNFEAAMGLFTAKGDAVEVPTALFFLAMTAFQLKKPSEAEDLYQEGIREFQRRLAGPDGPPIADYRPDRWLCWGQVEVARRQADALIHAAAAEK